MESTARIEWPRLEPTTLARLRARRPILACALLSLNLGIYCGLAALSLSTRSWWLSLVALPLQSLILCGLFSVVHDCVHNGVFRIARANRVLGAVLAALLLSNFTLYKAFHTEHHAKATLSADPEGVRRLRRPRDYVLFILSIRFFSAMWRQTIQAVRGQLPPFVRDRKLRRAILADGVLMVVWFLSSGVLSVLLPREFATAYLLPLAGFFPMMNLTSLPEHFATRSGRSVIGNTRSTDSNLFFTALFWYNNLHAEHHAFPSVPSYNLPQVRTLIGHVFAFREPSYIHFHAHLVTKLWRGRHYSKDASGRG